MEWGFLDNTAIFQLFTRSQKRLEATSDFLKAFITSKVRCKIIGCHKVQELQISFVISVPVFKDEH